MMYYIIVIVKTYVFVRSHVHVKTAFSKSSVFIDLIRYVKTEAVSAKKNLRFQLKKDTCGQGLKIWSFHAVVLQGLQRNLQKSVMHVQSCCFVH